MSDQLSVTPEEPEAGGPDGPQMFEQDRMGGLTPVVGAGSAGGRRMLGLSMPGAMIGVLLIGSVAFGAGTFGLVGLTAKPTEAPVAPGLVIANGGTDDDREDPAEDGTKPDGDQKPGTPDEPKDPEPTDDRPAEPELLKLEAALAAGKVRVEWTACDPAGFAYYKLVRSSDETVTWPAGTGDALVAALERPSMTGFTDGKASPGRYWYRVFALAKVDGTLVVACASNVDGIKVPAPEGEPDADPTSKPTEKPTAKPTEKPTEKPDPEPTDKPDPMSLAVAIKDGHPLVDWSACDSDRFDYYKVVWSKDSTVKWPAGDNDVVAAVIGDRDQTKFWDKKAPAGKTLSYRVFCIDKTADGYKVVTSTGVKSVKTPAAEPAPDPVTLAFEVGMVEGGVKLAWEPCSSDAFVYYKVVRSKSDNPSYLPWTAGTELIGVIGTAGEDGFVDEHVESGETWSYRVQAIGKWNGGKVLLGQTAVIEVTVP